MTEIIELIAVPDHSANGTADHLIALTRAIEASDHLQLLNSNDVFVSMAGPVDELEKLIAQFAGNVVFEENRTLQMIPPAMPPKPAPQIQTDTDTDDSDDPIRFDEDDIRIF